MKTLIVYASKTGTTERCAKTLESKLRNTTLVNILECDTDIQDYDLIIIGSNIRIGKINSKIKEFVKKNKDVLISKKTAYFICCGFPNNYKSYFENNFPRELLDKSLIYDTFGGEMDISKQKGLDKLIVKLVSKTKEGKKEIKVLDENIDKFIKKIKH